MSTAEPKYLEWSSLCYRRLLRVYPEPFLSQFESQLLQTFGDLARRAMASSGGVGLAALWCRIVPDLFKSALQEHFRVGLLPSRWSYRWVLACFVGFSIGSFLVLPMALVREALVATQNAFTGAGGFLELSAAGETITITPYAPMYHVFPWSPFALIWGLLVGAPLAWLQAREIGWDRRRATRWTVATIAGFMLLSSFVMNARGGPEPISLPIGILVFLGPVMGFLQAASAGLRRLRVWLWIPACAIALSFGSVMGFGIGAALFPGAGNAALRAFLFLPVCGFVFGIFTAPFAEWMFRPTAVQSLPKEGTPETGGALP